MNPVNYGMLRVMEEKVYKICIIDLNELKQCLRMEWAKLDHVITVAPIR